MLKAAENVVLQNAGERIVLTCGAGQQALRAETRQMAAVNGVPHREEISLRAAQEPREAHVRDRALPALSG